MPSRKRRFGIKQEIALDTILANEKAGRVFFSGVKSEDELRDEIVERNLAKLRLFEERERFQRQLRRVSRFHLLALADGLARFRSSLGEIIWGTEG